MPYIKPEDKPELDDIISMFPQLTEPDLDYVITQLAIRTLKHMPQKFISLNKIWGVMTGAAIEFYRRLVGPYEDLKAAENGDVYTDIRLWFKIYKEKG